MTDCVHHWRQETGQLKAPFVCIHCGATRDLETNFHDLMDKKLAGATPWRGTSQPEDTPVNTQPSRPS